MKIHTILILAGGDGDRFFPLEQKLRFRFIGKTVLQHVIESVSEYAEKVIVVVNRRNESLIKSDLVAYPVQFVTQINDGGGMADAVLAAEEFLSKDILILNGNDLIDFSIIPVVITQTKKDKTLLGFVAKKIKKYFPSGYVRFDGEMAGEIIEKPLPENVPSEYVRLVTDYFPDIETFIKELKLLGSTDDQYERGMSSLMKQRPATCLKYTGDWTTIKYSWHVLSMQEYCFEHYLKKSIDSTVTIHKMATIEGETYLGKNVKIGAFSKISGPCYIGDDVIIGDHCSIRNSIIERGSLVGSACEVARSYLGEGVMLHRNYVGDSVLSAGVSMGAGAVTANFRFDGKTIQTPVGQKITDSQKEKFGLIAGNKVKIGVNASTYPGVKLSTGTKVLPGEVVKKDR